MGGEGSSCYLLDSLQARPELTAGAMGTSVSSHPTVLAAPLVTAAAALMTSAPREVIERPKEAGGERRARSAAPSRPAAASAVPTGYANTTDTLPYSGAAGVPLAVGTTESAAAARDKGSHTEQRTPEKPRPSRCARCAILAMSLISRFCKWHSFLHSSSSCVDSTGGRRKFGCV